VERAKGGERGIERPKMIDLSVGMEETTCSGMTGDSILLRVPFARTGVIS
jgi:hypothetical protein